jgi:hypothetical protein
VVTTAAVDTAIVVVDVSDCLCRIQNKKMNE